MNLFGASLHTKDAQLSVVPPNSSHVKGQCSGTPSFLHLLVVFSLRTQVQSWNDLPEPLPSVSNLSILSTQSESGPLIGGAVFMRVGGTLAVTLGITVIVTGDVLGVVGLSVTEQ